jgi:hypothetical protein
MIFFFTVTQKKKKKKKSFFLFVGVLSVPYGMRATLLLIKLTHISHRAVENAAVLATCA